mgnify:CR=1 FL=1
MATSTVPIAVAIMAHRTLREASDAGMPLAVFTSDLTRLPVSYTHLTLPTIYSV